MLTALETFDDFDEDLIRQLFAVLEDIFRVDGVVFVKDHVAFPDLQFDVFW